jgi:excisionase family DNA binding protein
MPGTNSRELLTITAAAERLSIHRSTIWRAVRRGELPALRLGRRFFVDVTDLGQLAVQQAQKRAGSGKAEAENPPVAPVAAAPPEHKTEGCEPGGQP